MELIKVLSPWRTFQFQNFYYYSFFHFARRVWNKIEKKQNKTCIFAEKSTKIATAKNARNNWALDSNFKISSNPKHLENFNFAIP